MSKVPKFSPYVDGWSVAPGSQARLDVSTEAERFTAQLVRITRGGPQPVGQPEVFEYEPVGEEQTLEGSHYESTIGSCVVIPTGSALWEGNSGLSLRAWIWPTAPDFDRMQTILGSNVVAFGIRGGVLRVEVDGNERVSGSTPLLGRRWYEGDLRA